MTALHDYLGRGSQYSLSTEELVGSSPYNEIADEGQVRPQWSPILTALRRLTSSGLGQIDGEAARLLEDDGVTYNRIEQVADDQGKPTTRSVTVPWTLDVVPLVIGPDEWTGLAAGIEQRSRLLDAIVTDLYGERRLLSSGILPPTIVYSHGGYLRPAHGITVPGRHQLLLAAADLGRSPDGQWQVIADRTQAPSGSAYAMENRRVMSRLFPEIHHDVQIERLLPFFHACREAIAAAAPASASDIPQVVVLSPGGHSETAFDQAYFASLLGYPLVEGSDLVMRDGRVWIRATGKLDPVDVIIRRVDATYTDPLFLRAGSHLGVPGLVDAARRGTVSVLNGLGSGVLENPGIMAFLPRISRELLGEDLLLPSVTTYWCGDGAARSHVLANINSMVVRPIDRDRAPSVYAGEITAEARDELIARIEDEPFAWVGQELLALSHSPTVVGTQLAPRPVTLRTFAVAADGHYKVMHGGVARVPVVESALELHATERLGARTVRDLREPYIVGPFVGSLRPSASKDVWVLTGEEGDPSATGWLHDGPTTSPADPFLAMSPRILSDLFWIGRYSARAEDLVRLLLSVREMTGDLRSTPAGGAGEAIAVMRQAITQVTTTYPGFLEPTTEPVRELRSLMTDDRRMGTFAQSVSALHEALQGVRDQLSQDVWLVMGTVERAIGELRAAPDDLGSLLVSSADHALAGLLGLSGIFLDNMIHDPGWHLLNAGRAAERSLHIISLLRSAICLHRSSYVDALLIDAVLEATESIVTYRRRYRGRAHIEGVLQLLLFDNHNPRSLAYQLQRLGEHIPRFSSGQDDEAAVPEAFDAVLARLRGVDAVTLARTGPDGERDALHDYLGELYDGVRRVCQAIQETHLRSPGLPRQMFEGTATPGEPS